ncbi:hypothetical protein A3218_00765 [Pseudomonas chlororaphis]|uniref:lysis system i-spanin subunit Rz n=1 Tax=Pseudomonas chlororaphis TaxID=587753 RepID=UPI000789FA64|nr:lysis system i-spanin subunit Rz [Pseudomonas chlororaphis]AMS12926.1 hypothetical protein A3218_00765 [Pseudomonas chlororaphis]
MTALFLRLIPLIIAVVTAASASWMIQGWRYGAQIESIQRANADTLAQISHAATRQLQSQLELHQEQTQKITQLDQQHYEALKDVQANNLQLAADLAATRQRLSVRVLGCSAGHLPATANAASMDDGAQRAELYPQDAAALAAVTADADRCAVKLSGLQAYVCSVQPSSAGCRTRELKP